MMLSTLLQCCIVIVVQIKLTVVVVVVVVVGVHPQGAKITPPPFRFPLQSYSFFPTIDKPTRVYNNSATLIDNIFANNVCRKISRGNIILYISDRYS